LELSAYSIDKNFESVLHYYRYYGLLFVRFIVLDSEHFFKYLNGEDLWEMGYVLLTVLVFMHQRSICTWLLLLSNLYFLFEASKLITVNGPKSEIYWFSFFPSFCFVCEYQNSFISHFNGFLIIIYFKFQKLQL
jgi:hypothetical protein